MIVSSPRSCERGGVARSHQKTVIGPGYASPVDPHGRSILIGIARAAERMVDVLGDVKEREEFGVRQASPVLRERP